MTDVYCGWTASVIGRVRVELRGLEPSRVQWNVHACGSQSSEVYRQKQTLWRDYKTVNTGNKFGTGMRNTYDLCTPPPRCSEKAASAYSTNYAGAPNFDAWKQFRLLLLWRFPCSSWSASISTEISFHLPWGFETTGGDRQWFLGLAFLPLLDHPVCFSVMARFKKSRCSLSVLTRVPISQMKRKKIWDSQWFQKASFIKHFFVTTINEGQEHRSPFHSPILHFLVHIPLSVSCLVRNCSHRCQHARSQCVRTARKHGDPSWYFAIYISSPSNVWFNCAGAESHSMLHCTTHGIQIS